MVTMVVGGWSVIVDEDVETTDVIMQTIFHILKRNRWIQVKRITSYKVSKKVASMNLNTLSNRLIRRCQLSTIIFDLYVIF